MAVIGFKKEFPMEDRFRKWTKKTLFAEKILSCWYNRAEEIPKKYQGNEDIDYDMVGRIQAKIHTIRKPSKTRKEGSKLHFTINARGSNQFQFAPVKEVVSIQKLKIAWTTDHAGRKLCKVWVDREPLGMARWHGDLMTYIDRPLLELIRNDGFALTQLFFEWFAEDRIYDLIHWTDKTYVGNSKTF